MAKFSKVLGAKEFSFLSNVTEVLSSSLNIQESLSKIFKLLSTNFGIKHSFLTRYNEIQDTFFIKVSYGLNPTEIIAFTEEKWHDQVKNVIEHNKVLFINHLNYHSVYFDELNGQQLDENYFVCLPLVVGNDKFGTLTVSATLDEYEDFDVMIRLLTIVCLMIAQELKLKKLLEQEKEHLHNENIMLRNELSEKYNIDNMIGKSSVMHSVFENISQVSSSNVSVLILGESGTGKELVAHAIHYRSQRASGPFIRINCGAIPDALIESELFGHKRGAFTDAIETKIGKFEAANGGTIFLDEIAELSPQLQVKLLRVLQDKEVTRVGDVEPIKIDVRVITATNKDLEKAMESGEIREDFYYRLNVFPINIPPLRQRRTDIMLIAEHFLEKFSKEHSKKINRISPAVIDVFYSYKWPGNVRELENCIERAVIMCNDEILQINHLPSSLQSVDTSSMVSCNDDAGFKEKVSSFEKKIIMESLYKTKGNVSMAAQYLKTTQRILGYKIEKFNIDVTAFKSG